MEEIKANHNNWKTLDEEKPQDGEIVRLLFAENTYDNRPSTHKLFCQYVNGRWLQNGYPEIYNAQVVQWKRLDFDDLDIYCYDELKVTIAKRI